MTDGRQTRKCPVEQLPRRPPVDIGNQADAARVALARGVVQESSSVVQTVVAAFRLEVAEKVVRSRLGYELDRRGGRDETPASAWAARTGR
jgi:hypothetical protein